MSQLTAELFAAALDGLADAVAVLDADGRIVHANERWRRPSDGGSREADPVGRDLVDAWRGADDEAAGGIARALEQLLAGEREVVDAEYASPVDDDRWYQLHAARVVVSGQVHAVVSCADVTRRRRAERALERRGERDELTGLLNRESFHHRLEQTLQGAARRGNQVAVLVFDLDGFHDINAELGRAVGDVVLRIIAGRLQEGFRAEDAVARSGDDQFVLFVEHAPESIVLGQVIARLQDALRGAIELEERTLSIGASLGVSIYPLDGEDVDTVLERAHEAMQRAKRDPLGPTCYAANLSRR